MAPLRPSTDFRLAKDIRVEADRAGVPHIIIDGEPLPWFTSGIVPSAPSIGGMATLTITIPAETITLANNLPTGITEPAAEGTALGSIEAPAGRLTDEFLRSLAAAYDELAEANPAPAAAIARKTGAPVRTVHRWIAEARKRGHLPPGRQGRVG